MGRVEESAPLASDRRIEVTGAGEGRTVLDGGLRLGSPRAAVADLTTRGLELDGTGHAPARALAGDPERDRGPAGVGGRRDASRPTGPTRTPACTACVVRASGDDGVRACIGALLRPSRAPCSAAGRPGPARAGGSCGCATRSSPARSSAPLDGPVDTAVLGADHGPIRSQIDRDGRLPAGSPLIDAGSPDPLSAIRMARGPRRPAAGGRRQRRRHGRAGSRARSSARPPPVPLPARQPAARPGRARTRPAAGRSAAASRSSATARGRSRRRRPARRSAPGAPSSRAGRTAHRRRDARWST